MIYKGYYIKLNQVTNQYLIKTQFGHYVPAKSLKIAKKRIDEHLKHDNQRL